MGSGTLIKPALMLAGFVLMISIVWSVPRFRLGSALYTLSYLAVVGNVLFPIWLFQGLERITYLTVFNVLVRLLSVSGILILVQRQEDYLMAAAIQASVLLVSGLLALLVLERLFPRRAPIPTGTDLRWALHEGWPILCPKSGEHHDASSLQLFSPT